MFTPGQNGTPSNNRWRLVRTINNGVSILRYFINTSRINKTWRFMGNSDSPNVNLMVFILLIQIHAETLRDATSRKIGLFSRMRKFLSLPVEETLYLKKICFVLFRTGTVSTTHHRIDVSAMYWIHWLRQLTNKYTFKWIWMTMIHTPEKCANRSAALCASYRHSVYVMVLKTSDKSRCSCAVDVMHVCGSSTRRISQKMSETGEEHTVEEREEKASGRIVWM